ncbi:MAG: ATP-binding cassette domain-containing protein [Atopobiaceae bacterium]|jgi:energy-coupling factor transport system ATP-binding protein|nr:ATP-binding cassette domain-containing protein [Atopobiaceae bacterium]
MAEIVINNLRYRYPETTRLALNGITCQIHQGEFIGVIGRNGAGKSTFSQALLGLVPNFYHGAYGGSVTIDGVNVKESSVDELCQKVGLVFQNPFNQITGSKLTVYEEIAFGLENFGVPSDEMHRRIDNAMELLDISELKNRVPYDLSGGQMQRMALAGIIVMEPEVIVMDEPTSQLDPQGSEEVFRAVRALKNQGKTIIMIEHKIEKIAAYSDCVMLLDDGKLVAMDTPKVIFSRDDLAKHGVCAPTYTQICRELNIRDRNGLFPVTLEETRALLDADMKERVSR